MQLTDKQIKGLDGAVKAYRDGKLLYTIAGYAGTGKSTLVKYIIAALGEFGINPEKDVCYVAYTGKACTVLQKKGCKNVRTGHKLLYHSIPKESGGYMRIPYQVGEIEYKVIVLDEVSMFPATMMTQLRKHGIFILALGDPFQLPPIDKNEDNHILDKPDIFLDEIMRQAQESEIIRLTMDIRAGKPIKFMQGEELQVLPEKELSTGMLNWADQVLCATNASRINLNNEMRQLNGFNAGPQEGDKVICLRNYWELSSAEDNALVNGTIGYLKNPFESFIQLPRWTRPNVSRIDVIQCDFITEDGDIFPNLMIDKEMFYTGEPTLDWKTSYKLGRNVLTRGLIPLQFAYGYAITCHKAQGSEWNKVLAIEEPFPFVKEEHARWLYTACTRASEKLVLLR